MRTSIAAVVSPALLLAIATPATAQQGQLQGYGPWYSDGWPFWWICPLMMLLMIGVAAVFLLSRRHRGGGLGFGPGSGASALQILNERFARGEIERQEYEDRKAAILSAR